MQDKEHKTWHRRHEGHFDYWTAATLVKTPYPEVLLENPLLQGLLTPFESFNFEHLWRKTPTPDPKITPKEQTNTEESFQTTPELSAPTERIFKALLGKRKPEEPPIETPTRKMTKKNETTMKATTKVRGGKTTPFSRKRETLEKFLEMIGLHLLLNKIKNNEERIAFSSTWKGGMLIHGGPPS